MTKPFYAEPILNSPYLPPTHHHALDDEGQPLDHAPIEGRRVSRYLVPVPRGRRGRSAKAQRSLDLDQPGISSGKYTPNALVNEIRGHLERWRALQNPADWGVTPVTQRLLQHWRHHEFIGPRPFFCQLEAVETIIWLTEVARGRKQYASLFRSLQDTNHEANPDLFRLALKLATGAGKTTVMAMLIAWQAINASRQPSSSLFSRAFLIVTPGITIKDRLRVLLPSDSESYYRNRDLVPADLMNDLGKARIVITNYHAFQRRKALELNPTAERLIQGRRGKPVEKDETEGAMLQRACGDLLTIGNVVVLNDEAHHCYREREGADEEAELKGEEKEEAKENNKAARLWISGLEALKRKAGVRALYDLSATPFFLRGSGYQEGTLFPWVVSDFSLVDAIECGIVKLPRVPVADNAVHADTPVYRNLWDHIGKDMPKKGAGKSGDLDPLQLPAELQTALNSLYSHYTTEFDEWERAGIGVPPVFIVVCNNTASSKLVFEWVSGWRRERESEPQTLHKGHLKLFSNFDEYGNPLERMNTLLIDSQQIESGELDSAFRQSAELEIEQFRREKMQREGAASGEISDAELLREVMNTVGQKGRLGEQIRCVVSVSMLTEGWDANTVTHILGVRAFGTQLLCEQVIGRGLRRQSYELNEKGLFDVEYADILGIPFDFATEPQKVVRTPPKPVTRIQAVREREALAISFPRVAGYRTDLPPDRIRASFTADSTLRITPELVGPCTTRLEGLVGEGIDISPDALDEMRENQVAVHLTKRLIELYFREGEQDPPYYLYNQLQPITRRWVKDHVQTAGGTKIGMLTYAELAEKAANLIYGGIVREANEASAPIVKAMLDSYNPRGSTNHIGFNTTKAGLWKTAPDKSHVNYVVCDSDWEAEFARVVEAHAATLAYVKNQGLGFDIPYLNGAVARRYIPDFIVQIDDARGGDDPLNVVVEIKGYRGLDAQLKAQTMETLWIPGVNNLKTFGRWAFAEFRDAFAVEEEWRALVEQLRSEALAQKEFA